MKKTAKEKWIEDEKRKEELELLGYKVLTFWNSDINNKFEDVLNNILDELRS